MDHHDENNYDTDRESESEVTFQRGKKRNDPTTTPNKPTKFLTAYNLYTNSVRSSIEEANPEAGLTDIFRVITTQFKLLTKQERAKLDELARQDKERYYNEMENYYDAAAPSDDDSEGVVHQEANSKPKKKKKKDPNLPKRGMTAYFLYSNNVRSKIMEENPGIKFGDVAKLISSKYKKLSQEERAKYDKLAAADKERYQTQMAQFKETGTFD